MTNDEEELYFACGELEYAANMPEGDCLLMQDLFVSDCCRMDTNDNDMLPDEGEPPIGPTSTTKGMCMKTTLVTVVFLLATLLLHS